jgi:hypothetical protein
VTCRYGKIDSVRLRSLPVDLDAKMPRRAKQMLGKVRVNRKWRAQSMSQ